MQDTKKNKERLFTIKAYLDILKNCLESGTLADNRTGIPAIRVPQGAKFEHDMENGFPLLTTKKMGLKNISTELEFFIKGYTDKKWLQDRKCHIWDEWATKPKWEETYRQKAISLAIEKQQKLTDEEHKQLKNECMDNERDLGPVYGWQWRHFGGELHDVHIYENHIDQVKEQLSREPYELPTVEIPDKNWNGMLNWSAKDGFILKDYVCHEALKGEVAR